MKSSLKTNKGLKGKKKENLDTESVSNQVLAQTQEKLIPQELKQFVILYPSHTRGAGICVLVLQM